MGTKTPQPMVGTLNSTAAGHRRPPSLQVPRQQQAARGADSPLSPPCWNPASPGGAGIARSYSINSVASPGSVTPEELSRILWAKHPGCRGWTPTTPPLRGAPRTFAQFQRTVNKPITSSERSESRARLYAQHKPKDPAPLPPKWDQSYAYVGDLSRGGTSLQRGRRTHDGTNVGYLWTTESSKGKWSGTKAPDNSYDNDTMGRFLRYEASRSGI